MQSMAVARRTSREVTVLQHYGTRMDLSKSLQSRLNLGFPAQVAAAMGAFWNRLQWHVGYEIRALPATIEVRVTGEKKETKR